MVLVVVLIAGYYSGGSYTDAYGKIQLPPELEAGTCKFGTVAKTTKQRLECTATFKSSVNEEMTAASKSFDDAGYSLDRNVVLDNGTGVMWAENGTFLVQIQMTGKKTRDGFEGQYDAVVEKGAGFNEFN